MLIDEEVAEELKETRQPGARRPPKPKGPVLYLYIGGGVDKQPDCIMGIVVRTRDPGVTAALATTCRLLSMTFPRWCPVEVTSDLIELGSDEAWAKEAYIDLQDRLRVMWAHWARILGLGGIPASAEQHDWQAVANVIYDALFGELLLPPVAAPAPSDDVVAAVLQQLSTILNIEDEQDEERQAWGAADKAEGDVATAEPFDDEDMDVPVPRPLPQQRRRRVGVDLGGVLTPKLPMEELRRCRTRADVDRIGFVPGASEWFRQTARECGPENLFIISYIRSQRVRDLFTDFLGGSGLLHETGVPRENLIFTDARSGPDGKGHVFVRFHLTHFVDDQSEVLMDILDATWRDRREEPPLGLFLVPTCYFPEKFGDIRCCHAAARKASQWGAPWCIYVAPSLADVQLP